ncbi:MAG: 23S rRNA (uracil(1939)-C(5))-methyltransferase RlmD [Gammaproteobacteria bacterium]|nr:23S rRNA (uracil(1939)-C(5))-methyltransferase RlmD [Gammaproteobacteria bacterium]
MSDKRRRRCKQRLPDEPVQAEIESLSAEGRGITHVNDRIVFVDQALPGETVTFKYTKLSKNIAEGRTVEVLKPSADRVKPKCQAFELCGGCSLQHMDSASQLSLKQQAFLDHLEHIGMVKAKNILPPLTGPLWGYRHKARLGVRYVNKKDKILVGFRERNSSYITDTQRCEILHPSVGGIITELAECIASMVIRERIPQIEVAVGDNQTVLVFRHLDPMPESDRVILSGFAAEHNLVVYLQAGSPDELEALYPAKPETLYYELPNYNVRVEFQPSDFTQVNPEINRNMLDRAIDFLQLTENDQVLDLFCGLGNFSLPMARRCAQVTAVEGAQVMVVKGRENAAKNNIDNIEFFMADLYSDEIASAPWLKKKYNKILLDPPRSGADAVLKYLARMGAERIVYVSCHPATLARDAGVLVNELGYTLTDAGIMDMFPHTSHVESIAVFVKQ